MRSLLIPLLLCLAALPATAQTSIGYTIDERGDTLYVDRINPVYVFNRPPRNSGSWREYYKLVYNFNKTYPYALIAKDRILWADSLLAARDYSKREREKIIRTIEKALFREFEAPLRNLTITQGAMLMKLIDREVGQTSYYVIRNYRGGAVATLWQGVARLFGSNLKAPYDKYGADKRLEQLVQMYQQGSFYYLYVTLFGLPRNDSVLGADQLPRTAVYGPAAPKGKTANKSTTENNKNP